MVTRKRILSASVPIVFNILASLPEINLQLAAFDKFILISYITFCNKLV